MSDSIFACGIKREILISRGLELLSRHGGSVDELYERIDKIPYKISRLEQHPIFPDEPQDSLHHEIKIFDAMDGWATDGVVKAMISYAALSINYMQTIQLMRIIRFKQDTENHFNDSFELKMRGNHLIAMNLPNYSGAGSAANSRLRSFFAFLSHIYEIDIQEVIRSEQLINA